ncbi:MAG TPA: TetR/AcrR family transcriptional regulator, partial [Nitrospiria bacterium]|nr:TetR/AcrR family transcriptional regulator [Nitrospiria bacterium]
MLIGNKKSKKEVVAEFRMAELLEAARVVFAGKGFQSATVDDIADAAGVAKGTVYLYYRSKREIYWAALERGVLDLFEETRKNVESARTPEAKLHAFVATKIAYFDRHRDFFKIYFSEFGSALTQPAHIYKHFEGLYLRYAGLLTSILQEGIKRKVIRNARPEMAAHAISDVIRGVTTQRILGWSKTEIDDEVEF